MLRRPATLACVCLCVLIAGGVLADYYRGLPEDAVATYIGRGACAECHQAEMAAFHGSDHDLAMDHATDASVLGDFNDVTFEHDGITSRMYRDGAKFMIHTEGPTGAMEDFQVKFVFGVRPLQQYMVEFDRDETLSENEIGRVQVLRISWDTQRQEWFYLRPPDVDEKLAPGDPLHWTGIAQRWQTMCAECHSTHLKRNYDVATQRYHTTFSEIDVSCEACHGPASLHVELANRNSLFWDRHRGYALADLKTVDAKPQLETCAPCHSRRGVLDAHARPGDEFTDHYSLELLRAGTYHADGQIKDEVYVYGSFLQSKMYHKGIRCTDCHDPHSLQLKHPGNETCTSCHQHAPGKYDVPSHHHHAVGSEGAKCVNCHMPHTTYMAVDARRDHSLRVPRPDLSVKLGTPNACSACHVNDQRQSLTPAVSDDLKLYQDWLEAAEQGDEAVAEAIRVTDQWCDDACEMWYGENRLQPPHFAEVLAGLRSGDEAAVQDAMRLIAGSSSPATESLAPVIARATALEELLQQGHREAGAAAQRLIDENKESPDAVDPLLLATVARTIGMLGAGGAISPQRVVKDLLPLTQDPSRLVRSEAARGILTAGAYPRVTGTKRLALDKVLADVHDEWMVADDRADAHLGWAMLSEQRGQWVEAIRSYNNAIRVQPTSVGARSNLAALLDRLLSLSDRDPAAAKAVAAVAKAVAVADAGERAGVDVVAQVEAQIERLRDQELPLLARDAALAPNLAEVQYRYGLALYLSGDSQGAEKYIQRAVELAPDVDAFAVALRALQEQINSP